MSAEPDRRDKSQLEIDDEYCCMDCGIALPYDAVIIYGFDRCPECHMEYERKSVVAAFGSLSTVDAMASWSTEPPAENADVSDGDRDE